MEVHTPHFIQQEKHTQADQNERADGHARGRASSPSRAVAPTELRQEFPWNRPARPEPLRQRSPEQPVVPDRPASRDRKRGCSAQRDREPADPSPRLGGLIRLDRHVNNEGCNGNAEQAVHVARSSRSEWRRNHVNEGFGIFAVVHGAHTGNETQDGGQFRVRSGDRRWNTRASHGIPAGEAA